MKYEDAKYYNQEVKEDFLEHFTPEEDDPVFYHKYQPNILRQLFIRTARAEEEIGRDIGDMEIGDLNKTLEAAGAESYIKLVRYLRYLRKYLDWYFETQSPTIPMVTQPDWRQIDLTPYFQKTMIRGPEQIVSDWFDVKPEDGYYIQPIYILAWYGIPLQNALEIKKSDVSFGGGKVTIQYDGGELVIDDEISVSVLRNYQSFTETQNRAWKKPNVDTFIYRRIKPDAPEEKGNLTRTIAYSNIQASKRRRGDVFVNRYDATNLRTAGIYYKICMAEKEKGRLSDDDIKTLSGGNWQQQWYADAVRLSAWKYKQAFNL